MMSVNFPSSAKPISGVRGAGRFKIAMFAAVALVVLPAASACSRNSSTAPQSQAANANDPIVARVNGAEIRQSDLAVAEEDLGSELQGAADHKREQLIAYLTDVLLVAQAAEKQNVAESAEFKRRQALMRNKLLMGFLLQSHAKSAATDAEMHKVYDEAVKPMGAEDYLAGLDAKYKEIYDL